MRYLILFLLGCSGNIHHWHAFQMINDEAYLVHGAQRWMEGSWPYWDWDTRTAPGGYAIAAVFMSIFGDDQGGTRLLMLIIASLQGLLIFYLSQPLSGRLRYLPWLAWTLIGLGDFPILGYHWMSSLSFSAMLACCLNWVQHGRSRTAVGTGLLLALTGFLLQSEALAGMIVIVLCWLRWRPGGLGWVVLACVLGSLLLWSPFFPVWRTVLQDCALDMQTHLRFNHHAYSWLDLWPMFQGAWASSLRGDPLGCTYIWTRCAVYSLKYGCFYVVLALSLWLSWRRQQQTILLLAVGVASLALANLNRQTLEYLSYLCPLWFILLFWLLDRRGYWLMAGLSLYWIMDLSLWERDYRYPISTPAGLYFSSAEWESKAYSKVNLWVGTFVKPGQEVLSFPFLATIYSLWKVKNPVREVTLIPVSMSRANFERANQRLRARQVPWIVFAPMSPRDCNVDPAYFSQTQTQMLELLTADYELVQDYLGMRLYRRRAGQEGQ